MPGLAQESTQAFPYLLLPSLWSSRNRARRRERGDLARGIVFGGIALLVTASIFYGAYWLTLQVAGYAELGDYLIRLGLSWLFLTFLSFLAFSSVVTSLSTFFLSDDLRLLMVAPVASRRLFFARFARTVGQASWMVVVFMTPILAGVGVARSAPPSFYLVAVFTVAPFVMIPVALGSMITLGLVNVFPAKRARDILMLMGLVFATSIVLLLRFIQPERLLRVESMPEVTDFFATLQSPITPLLPSFWAGETLFASLQGGADLLHFAALWTTALSLVVVASSLFARWHFAGFSKAQEARKVRFARWQWVDGLAALMPMSVVRRQLLVKDLKVFLRDVSQWSQLLLLLALMLVYLYNFQVLDLERIPTMSGFLKNIYAFLNLAMAGFVMATVAVRFVFPNGVGRGGRVLDHPHGSDFAARLPLVEVLDGPGPGAAAERVPHHRRQRAARCGPLPRAYRRHRRCLHVVRAGGAGHGPGRALSAVRGRQSQPGGRLVRRCRLHGPRRALRHRHHRAGGLALVCLPAAAGAPPPTLGHARGVDDGQLRRRGAGERGDVLVWHANGHQGTRGHGSDTVLRGR
jgi:hypothetical protein